MIESSQSSRRPTLHCSRLDLAMVLQRTLFILYLNASSELLRPLYRGFDVIVNHRLYTQHLWGISVVLKVQVQY